MIRSFRRENGKVLLAIAPTKYGDYDILALGEVGILKKLAEKNKHYHYMQNTKYKIPICLLDTCDTLTDAKYCLKGIQDEM